MNLTVVRTPGPELIKALEGLASREAQTFSPFISDSGIWVDGRSDKTAPLWEGGPVPEQCMDEEGR